jgi:hypothetical protein
VRGFIAKDELSGESLREVLSAYPRDRAADAGGRP